MQTEIINKPVQNKWSFMAFWICIWEFDLLRKPKFPFPGATYRKAQNVILWKRLYPFKTINSGRINCLKRISWDLTQSSIQTVIINKPVQNKCPSMAVWICIWQFDLLGKPKFPFPGATYRKAQNDNAFETFIYV